MTEHTINGRPMKRWEKALLHGISGLLLLGAVAVAGVVVATLIWLIMRLFPLWWDALDLLVS